MAMTRATGGKMFLAACSALVLSLCLGISTAPPAVAAPGKPSILAASPGNYIASWKQRARRCEDLTSVPWTDWTTYAGATVGNEWAITASNTKLCPFTANTADRLIESLNFNDGAGFKKIDWQGYALTVGEGRTDDPIGHDKPKGWQCFALPSIWGTVAWQYAELGNLGTPNDEAFGPASGTAAGGGYCVTGASSDAKGDWHGGKFVTWIPDGLKCKRRYHIKETPAPDDPLEVTFPSYGDVQIWGDYELRSC
jgi:hypothetical protein